MPNWLGTQRRPAILVAQKTFVTGQVKLRPLRDFPPPALPDV